MKDPESFVQQLLAARYGVSLAKIPETDQQTPDFVLDVGGERAFVAELKTLIHESPSEERGWEVRRRPDGITEASRPDNAPARLGSVIYKAWKQLRGYSEPKVVILLNEDSFVDVLDLEEAYTGQQLYEGAGLSYINTASKRVAAGNLSKVHGDIDLFIFIDRCKSDEVFFRFLTERGYDLARLFVDAPDQPFIPPGGQDT